MSMVDTIVGDRLHGSIVRHVENEYTERPNGKIRIRKSIELENGMFVMEEILRDAEELDIDLEELKKAKIKGVDKKSKKKKKEEDDEAKKKKQQQQKEEEEEERERLRLAAEKEEEEERAREEERRRIAEEYQRSIAEEKAQRHAAEEETARKKKDEEERLLREAQEEAFRKKQIEDQEEEKIRLLRKQDADEKIRKSQEELARRKREVDARRAEEQKMKLLAKQRAAIVESWQPKAIWAYSPGSNKGNDNDDDDIATNSKDAELLAIWKTGHSHSPDEKLEEDTWEPQEVMIHPPQKELPSDVQDASVQGFWTYVPGTEPGEDDEEWVPLTSTTSTSNNNNAGNNSNKKKPPQIIIYPPGVKPDDNEKIGGKWTFRNPLNKAWPPPRAQDSKTVSVNKLKQFDPTTVTVYPKHSRPKTSAKPIGEWFYPPGTKPLDDKDWAPQDVIVYAPNQGPEEDDTLVLDNKASAAVQGLWAFKPDNMAQNADVEEHVVDFSNILVLPPGVQLSPAEDDLKIGGKWTKPPGPLDREWPPQKLSLKPETQIGGQHASNKLGNNKALANAQPPRLARVYPKTKVPVAVDKDRPCSGMWRYEFGVDHDDEDGNWMPIDVAIYNKEDQAPDIDPTSPNGEWGVTRDAVPDADGNYPPDQTWFFAPGECPPDESEWQPMGTWASPPGELKMNWPPPSEFLKDQRPVGKLPKRRNDPKRDVKPEGSYVLPRRNSSTNAEEKNFDRKDKDRPKNGDWGFAPGGDLMECDNGWNGQPFGGGTSDDTPQIQKSVPDQKPAKKNEQEPKVRKRVSRPEKMPSRAWVYPESKAPKNSEMVSELQGVWTIEPGENSEGDWIPQELLLHEAGSEPAEVKDRTVPSGEWGYYSGPDDHENCKAKDVRFAPPGEKLPDNVQPGGIWTCPKGAKNSAHVQYRFEGSKMIYTKRTEMSYMGQTMVFTKEWEED